MLRISLATALLLAASAAHAGATMPAPPLLVASTNAVDFGTLGLGVTTAATVKLTNSGDLPLTVTGVSQLAPPFYLVGAPVAYLAPKATIAVLLRIQTTAFGTPQGSLQITSTGGTANISLTAQVSSSPASVVSPNGFKSLLSNNQKYAVALSDDGQLIETLNATSVVWSSPAGSNGVPPYTVKMQTDCNLVIYDSTNRAMWASGFGGSSPCTATVGDDGNFQVFDGTNAVQFSTGAVP